MKENKKFLLMILLLMVTMFFAPFFYFAFSPVIKKTQMDASVEAYKVTFESIYHEAGYDSDGDWQDEYYTYKPTYYYKINGMEFTYTTSSSSSSKSSYKNNMTIHYDKNNPSKAVAESEISVMPIIIVVGMYFMFVIGFGYFGYMYRAVEEDMNLGQ